MRRREGNAINCAVIPNPRTGINIKFANKDPDTPPKRSEEYKGEIIFFWSSTLNLLAKANIPDVRNPDITSAMNEFKKVFMSPEFIRTPNNKYIIIDEVINKNPIYFFMILFIIHDPEARPNMNPIIRRPIFWNNIPLCIW